MPVLPVQYEALKAVLLYMEPNIRFQISIRMPSISALESRIPLKIENLAFSVIHTVVNKISYKLGVYRDYGRNETPSDVLEMNQWGGSSDDINQYGLIIHPGQNSVLPGDIDLRRQVLQDVPADTEGQERHLVKQLSVLKMILAERLNQEYIEDDETRNAGDGGPVNVMMERSYRTMTLNRPIEFIQSWIQSIRDSLRPFNNCRDNRIPPYTPWIQFTRRSPEGVTIQRVAYNKYLYEATKTMHTNLLGNRGSSISVKNLNIDLPNQILRSPAGTILKIINLEVLFHAFFDCRHISAREAKLLIIDNNPLEDESWTPILLNLTNQRVFLMNENKHVPPNNYVDLIENWLERARPIGTTFSMGLKKEDTANQCLDTLKQRQEVLGSSEKQVQLRIDASLMLNVSYEMIEHSEDSYPSEYDSNLWLRLKVLRVHQKGFTLTQVCLENENSRNPPNNYMGLIENWLEKDRPIETCFDMGIKSEETVKQCLDTLRQRQEVIGSSEKQVQLRINALLMLNVSYEMAERRGRILREDQSKWWLILKVVRGRSD